MQADFISERLDKQIAVSKRYAVSLLYNVLFNGFMVFNSTFNNISVILVEETGISAEYHQSDASH